MFNVNINVLIGDKTTTCFDNEPYVQYDTATIGRILIDSGIAKSWSEVKGSGWIGRKIPTGISDWLLDGLKIGKDTWETRKNWSGYRPHRITILNTTNKEL